MKLILENWRRFLDEDHNYPHNLKLKTDRCKGKPRTGDCAPNPPTPEQKKKISAKNESEEDFKPHTMYDPESGDSEPADTYDRHLELKKKGWVHEKPELDEKKKKKKPCKPSKGKRFAKRVDGKCRSFGQSGKAKGGGDRIRPGTKKGDAYCARSFKIKKCKNPPCANALSRKKWKCQGTKSVAEEVKIEN